MTRYTRGRDFEHRISRRLEQAGYAVIRAASSKGAADLVAIGHGHTLLVQCKLAGSSLPPAEWNALYRLARQGDGLVPIAAFGRGAGRPPAFYELLDFKADGRSGQPWEEADWIGTDGWEVARA